MVQILKAEKSEVCCSKTWTLSLNQSVLITVHCFDRDKMSLAARTLFNDELMYCYGYYTSCPHNGRHPTHRLFFWLPSLCLKTNAACVCSAASLRELEMTNHQHHWEDADTAGRLRRPPPDRPDRLLRGSLRPTAHLQ